VKKVQKNKETKIEIEGFFRRRFFVFLKFFGVGFLVVASFLMVLGFARVNLLAANFIVLGENFGFSRLDSFKESLGLFIGEKKKHEVVVFFDGIERRYVLDDFGFEVDLDSLVNLVLEKNGEKGAWEYLYSFYDGESVVSGFTFDKEKVEFVLERDFSLSGRRAQDASVVFGENWEVTFLDDKEGVKIDLDNFLKDFERVVFGGDSDVVNLSLIKEKAALDVVFLEKNREKIEFLASKELDLFFGNISQKISWIKFPLLFTLGRSGDELNFFVDEEAFVLELDKFFGQTVSVAEGIVKISIDKGDIEKKANNGIGKIVFEGKPSKGREINREDLILVAKKFFSGSDKNLKHELKTNEIEPKVEVLSDKLLEIGIKEIVAIGHSTYYGSPNNRMHNIVVGLDKFDGVLISSGEEFSFNKVLGPVDGVNGYKPELVIKGNETIPEYGGGLCQVSTTFYKAAVFGGLPILQRSPHSYAVSYYAQVDGHGLDAAIYPEIGKDVVVKNDFEKPILMQAYNDGPQAFFVFYGTKDGREVELEGPSLSNYRSPGPKISENTKTLPPGKVKSVSGSHTGFDALWKRVIRKGGKETQEEIISNYRAVPAKELVGI
jgi:vancomycin resistance protein YoaR